MAQIVYVVLALCAILRLGDASVELHDLGTHSRVGPDRIARLADICGTAAPAMGAERLLEKQSLSADMLLVGGSSACSTWIMTGAKDAHVVFDLFDGDLNHVHSWSSSSGERISRSTLCIADGATQGLHLPLPDITCHECMLRMRHSKETALTTSCARVSIVSADEQACNGCRARKLQDSTGLALITDLPSFPDPYEEYKKHGADVRRHGWLMGIGAGVLVPVGVLLAGITRPWSTISTRLGPFWLVAHVACMGVGVILSAAGLAISWTHIRPFPTKYPDSPGHRVVGYFVLVGLLFQIVTAAVFARASATGATLSKVQQAWRKVHPWTGRLVLVLAMASVYTGIFRAADWGILSSGNDDIMMTFWYSLLLVIWGLAGAVLLVISCFMRRRERNLADPSRSAGTYVKDFFQSETV